MFERLLGKVLQEYTIKCYCFLKTAHKCIRLKIKILDAKQKPMHPFFSTLRPMKHIRLKIKNS